MSALPKRQTRWRHGRTCFEHPPLEDFIGPADGFFPVKAILDPEVGEEVVLYGCPQRSVQTPPGCSDGDGLGP